MLRNPVRALLAALMGTVVVLVAAPVASADTNEEGTLAVDILQRQVRLDSGGVVVVPLRARCTPKLDAFELDVAVNQRSRFGSTISIDAGVPTCDGQWHRTTVRVRAEEGRFHAGWADVGVYLGAYDTVEDHDTDATDDVSVRLRPAHA
jgi:hypothetical protein